MVLLCKVKDPERFGVAEFDEKGNLIKLVEKPKTPPSSYALTGIYFFTPIIFDMIKKLEPSKRGELEITEAIQLLMDANYIVGYELVNNWWKDTGTPEDILDANRLVLDEINPIVEGIYEDDSCIQGRVSIGRNTLIKRSSLIRGPSIIGNDSVIEPGVFIGPYTSIGSNVLVKQGEVENSIIMDGCTIDVNERIIDSLIGPCSYLSSNMNAGPKGRRFILGEKSRVDL